MVLTAENYYSKEANKEYMSVSQYKDFAGTYGKMACEFSAVEKLEERWAQKKTTPLLVGSYVDSYFEGTLEEFKKENPEIFTQKGELKANYKQAERIIARMERDPLFMQYMSGEKQVIMTGELFGAEWKIKIDSFVRGIAITDLIFRGQCRWTQYKGNDCLLINGPDTGYKDKIVIFAGGAASDSYKKIRGNSYGMWIATEINLHHDNTIKELKVRTGPGTNYSAKKHSQLTADGQKHERRNCPLGKRKRRIEEKEEELLSEQLKKTKIEIYECWTHIVISIVTMLIAVVTAVLTWFK